MFIRHGEKPGPGIAANGVTPDGVADAHSLLVRGWTRAGALVAFFMAPTGPIETPDKVFAATPDAAHGSPHGQRPSQTVLPLCDFRGKPADLSRAVGDEALLATDLLAEDRVVLVSWEHHAIRDIVRAVLGDPAWPNDWPDCFDLVWILTKNGATYAFSTLNQHLLAGDH